MGGCAVKCYLFDMMTIPFISPYIAAVLTFTKPTPDEGDDFQDDPLSVLRSCWQSTIARELRVLLG